MRYFVLCLNGECRIVLCNGRAPLSEINYAAFGVPYGVRFLGSERRLPLAMAMAHAGGFSEAVINGLKTSVEPVGVSGTV